MYFRKYTGLMLFVLQATKAEQRSGNEATTALNIYKVNISVSVSPN